LSHKGHLLRPDRLSQNGFCHSQNEGYNIDVNITLFVHDSFRVGHFLATALSVCKPLGRGQKIIASENPIAMKPGIMAKRTEQISFSCGDGH
jgi:hypothetical protein